MSKNIAIIGGGFGGLSAACYLARAGHRVTVYEKNDQVGGRAMVMKKGGFTFDLGPSWYMMTDVFEDFFADFGKKPSDYYELKKLDPSYKIFARTGVSYDVPTAPEVYELFDSIEPGSGDKLKSLLAQTKNEYENVRAQLLGKPMLKMSDVVNSTALKLLSNPELLGSYHSRIQKYVKNRDLQKILEFMVVFMGGSPKNIPALYSLLSYVDMGLGIWYPMGGFGSVVNALVSLARELGVQIHTSSPVERIVVENGRAVGVVVNGERYAYDVVVANADYHHVETALLNIKTRNWDKQVMSPSGLLIYLGVQAKIPALRHHNLLFDSDWDQHFDEVFEQKVWSKNPLLYVGAPSVTDPSVAPEGCENMFVLAPMASVDEPDADVIDETVEQTITRLEEQFDHSFKKDIIVQEVRAQNYFKETFNAYKGNAFGLAHTLKQSVVFRPKLKHPNVHNLYMVGQYTNPGTGVPLVILSGKVVANEINR